jgi:alkylhydroperoxidase family enzyme
MPRIEPAVPPYEPAIADALARIMPPGMEPLVLFRTMARNPRVFARMFAAGLLDKGAIGLRQRELVIDRTTARLGCEYEWGVHIALFAGKVRFGETEIAAIVHGEADEACWAPEERALLAVVDDLVDRRTITEPVWTEARSHFDEAQLLEVIALVGYYHTISFLCRALDLPLESYAARFPGSRAGAGSASA